MAESTMARSLTPSQFVAIFKPRIALMIALSAVGGAAITPGSSAVPWEIACIAIAVFLAAAAAGAFNQWAESDLDAHMARTASRPFASGLLRPNLIWLAGILALLAFAVGMAAITYTIWLKRRTSLNIVIGGAAGTFAVLAGATAVSPDLGPSPVLLAIVLFLWTPPHFWSLAIAVGDDYRHNSVPMLPAVIGDRPCAWVILGHTVALSVIALVPFFYGMGAVYLAFAGIGGALFTWTSIALVRTPSKKLALRNFLASLLQLLLLLTGAMLDGWVTGSFL